MSNSPLPWAIRITRAHAGAPKNVRICDHVGLTVAIVHGSAATGVTTESVNARKDANAALIVRACNHAERLAQALRGLRDGWERNLTEPMAEAMAALADYEEARAK